MSVPQNEGYPPKNRKTAAPFCWKPTGFGHVQTLFKTYRHTMTYRYMCLSNSYRHKYKYMQIYNYVIDVCRYQYNTFLHICIYIYTWILMSFFFHKWEKTNRLGFKVCLLLGQLAPRYDCQAGYIRVMKGWGGGGGGRGWLRFFFLLLEI